MQTSVSLFQQFETVALGCHNRESSRKFFPRGNNAQPGARFPEGGNTRWLFVSLGYIEQGSLYNQIVDRGSLGAAVTAGLLPVRHPLVRCPSDGFGTGSTPEELRLCSYVASTGPTCNNPPGGCPNPFQIHCNGTIVTGSNSVPPTLDPLTHPGYTASHSWGSTSVAANTRGMFSRGGVTIIVPNTPMEETTDSASADDAMTAAAAVAARKKGKPDGPHFPEAYTQVGKTPLTQKVPPDGPIVYEAKSK